MLFKFSTVWLSLNTINDQKISMKLKMNQWGTWTSLYMPDSKSDDISTGIFIGHLQHLFNILDVDEQLGSSIQWISFWKSYWVSMLCPMVKNMPMIVLLWWCAGLITLPFLYSLFIFAQLRLMNFICCIGQDEFISNMCINWLMWVELFKSILGTSDFDGCLYRCIFSPKTIWRLHSH